MRKTFQATSGRLILLAAAGAIVGSVFASNMGFKYTKSFEGPGVVSPSGTQDFGLPFLSQLGLTNASDLRAAIIAAGAGNSSVSRFNPMTDGLDTYAGIAAANDFVLRPAEAYRIRVNFNASYVVIGAHDPGLVVAINGPGTAGSASGTNFYSYPYHSTAETASQLRTEILMQSPNPIGLSISRFNPLTGGLMTYAGISGVNDFNLNPGEGYFIKTSGDVAYVPSHY